MGQAFCEKCLRTMNEDNFYTYTNGTKMEICKKCLTMHIDNFNEETFTWILKKMDLPYVIGEWNVIRDKAFAKDPEKMNGTTVFGKYLSKMKLKQWKGKTWADSDKLNEAARLKKIENQSQQIQLEQNLKQRLEAGDISEAEYKTLTSVNTQNEDYVNNLDTQEKNQNLLENGHNFYDEKKYVSNDILPDLTSELTDDDIIYLLMKWGNLYTKDEWIKLEKTYTEMMNSFDIQDADTLNTLLLICKTDLKMHQALDSGDYESFQKISKVSEGLRKSAKLTAAQNKEEKSDFVDCVGNIVAYCEEHGGQIPKYKNQYNLDIVDKVISDLKGYTKSLIYEDKALAKQIEDYLKKKEIAEQLKKDREEATSKGLEAVEMTEEDYVDYFNSKLEEQEQDKITLQLEEEK